MPPSRLRPTASFAADAILVGDPGRALLLAQELLEKPKMSNHARGLWGYSGLTPAGDELSIQSTGTGGPSAALVIADLAELGVRRAVRIGSCLATAPGGAGLGEVLVVERALAAGGSASAFGVAAGDSVAPDPALTEMVGDALGERARPAVVASFDADPATCAPFPAGVEGADMQTVAVLARAAALGMTAAAVLVAVGSTAGESLDEERREEAEKGAGRAASAVLSTSS
jgi:uridine phosphorylase